MSDAPPTLGSNRSTKAFKAWLRKAGAEVLDETNAYEVVRFRTGAGLSLIYSNSRGRAFKMTGEAGAAWDAFVDGDRLDLSPAAPATIHDPARRVVAMSDATLLAKAAERPLTIAFLMEHDQLPMRDASRRLFDLERAGRLARSGGAPGSALVWSPSP